MRKAIRSMVAALAVTCAVAAVSVPTLAASTPENADVRPTAPVGEYTFEMAEWDRIHAIADGTWGAEYTTCPSCGLSCLRKPSDPQGKCLRLRHLRLRHDSCQGR